MPKIMNILDEWNIQHEAYQNDGQLTDIFTNNLKLISDQGITFADIKNNPKTTLLYEPYGENHPFYLANYDWSKIMWKPALQQNYNLSVSGRRNNLTYFESVNYTSENGMLAYGTNYKNRLLITLKNDYDVTNWLKIKSNFNIGDIKMVTPYSYPQGETVQVLQPYSAPGHFMAIGGYSNPIANALAGSIIEPSYILNGTLGAELRPFKDLVIAGEISSNYNIQESDWSSIDYAEYDATDTFVGMHFGGLNQAGAGYTRTRYTVGDVNATYSFTKLENHAIKLLAGYSHEENDYRTFAAYRQYGLISAELPTMGAGSASYQYNSESKTDYALNSAYSRLDYSYKNRYMVEGIFRYDGTSKFAEGYKWSPFFGASGGWLISDEDFMKNLKNVVNFLKIRASWGQLGNQTGIGLYDYLSQINVGGSYPMGPWLSPVQTLNATLGTMPSTTRTWEKIETKNLGLDFSVFNSKLAGSFDYFIKDNKNMFFNQEYPQVLGTTAPNINGAHLRTKGYEVEIGWTDKISDFKYFVKLNFSNNNNKIISLADAVIPSMGTNNFVQGYPAIAYFGYQYDGIIQTASELEDYQAKLTGLPTKIIVGDVRYIDKNGDGKLTSNPYTLDENGKPTATSGDLVYLGDGGQHNLFGINLGFSWKNFDVSSFFQGVLKWNVIDNVVPCSQWWQRVETYFYNNTWAPDRPDAFWPAVHQDATIRNYDYQYSDAPYEIWNNKYIRLKNIQVGYTLPNSISERIHVSNLRVYFSGTDLWEHTNLPGKQDPETPFGQSVSPFPRQFSFGLSLTL
jgi:TonB-linked SusC/RagA family outer membrane protein